MSVELSPDQFSLVAPLYAASGKTFPLIAAVIQQKQRGQIFVDRAEYPNSAIVINNFGFMFYFGAEQNEFGQTELAQLLVTKGRLNSSYLLWYAPPEYWVNKFSAPGLKVRKRERIRFKFLQENAAYCDSAEPVPEGYELRDLDASLLPATNKFGLNIDSRFWMSADDVTANALGVCLVKNDEVVSLCYAAAVADGLAEVDVVTDENHRGKGLGLFVAQEFGRRCLAKGIRPTWDCFSLNTGSVRLAERLGFTPEITYDFYTFNVPLPADLLSAAPRSRAINSEIQ